MLELFLRGDLLVQSVAHGSRGVPADNAFHNAVALFAELTSTTTPAKFMPSCRSSEYTFGQPARQAASTIAASQ